MKIYKEKQLLNDSKMFIYTIIPFSVCYYFMCILALWMDIIENDAYVVAMALALISTFTIFVTLVFSYPYLLFELLIRKTIIFESDEIIVRSILGSKRIPYYAIKTSCVEITGDEQAKISITYNGQEYRFKIRHMSALRQLVDEMKLYFPVEFK